MLTPVPTNLAAFLSARWQMFASLWIVVALLGMPAVMAFHVDPEAAASVTADAGAADSQAAGSTISKAAASHASHSRPSDHSPERHRAPHDAAHCSTCVVYSSLTSVVLTLSSAALLPFDAPTPYVRPSNETPPVLRVFAVPAAPRGPPAHHA